MSCLLLIFITYVNILIFQTYTVYVKFSYLSRDNIVANVFNHCQCMVINIKSLIQLWWYILVN